MSGNTLKQHDSAKGAVLEVERVSGLAGWQPSSFRVIALWGSASERTVHCPRARLGPRHAVPYDF